MDDPWAREPDTNARTHTTEREIGRLIHPIPTHTLRLCSEVMDRMPPISILIVPWGPVAEGSAAMESYHDKLRSAIPGGEEAAANRIRGYSYRYTFRNLTTGAPGPGPTPFLTDQVVESLVWMGSKGLACDITLDKVLKDQSVSVLTDVTQLITRVYEEQGGGGRTKFVLSEYVKEGARVRRCMCVCVCVRWQKAAWRGARQKLVATPNPAPSS